MKHYTFATSCAILYLIVQACLVSSGTPGCNIIHTECVAVGKRKCSSLGYPCRYD
jgi:hypothetical protein